MLRRSIHRSSVVSSKASKISTKFLSSKVSLYAYINMIFKGQYYLPSFEECTVDYLRDIFSGKKKVIYELA